MKYCPKCKSEYYDRIHDCADCNVPLISEEELLQKEQGREQPTDHATADLDEKEELGETGEVLWGEDGAPELGHDEELEQETPADTSVGDMPSTGYNFRTLLSYGQITSALGWVIIVVGGIVFLAGLLTLSKSKGGGFTLMGIGATLDWFGFLTVATGQLFSCFVSIERNTRATQDLLAEMSKNAKV